MAITDSRLRLSALRKLLAGGEISTQEELADELRRLDFDITQSTISRDLRRVGAVKALNADGETVYRLSYEGTAAAPIPAASLRHLLLDIQHNDSMIVIHTATGSASLVARHLDQIRPEGILGTIAGDDTIFVAAASKSKIKGIIRAIYDSV
jgi:transcriptional regulator of arginine metabolism